MADRIVRVQPDAEALCVAALEQVVAAAARAVERDGRFTIALSGGSTPAPLFRLLAVEARMPWERTHAFWGDERCVPPDDEASNYRLAFDTMLSRAPIPESSIHRIRGELPCEEAAEDYALALTAFFGATAPTALDGPTFDLALQGMGADGHTASLFSGAAALRSERWTEAVVAPEGNAPAERVTLTLPVLSRSRETLVLVSGAAKAAALARALDADPDAPDAPPAARLGAVDDVVWLVDRAAGRGADGSGVANRGG